MVDQKQDKFERVDYNDYPTKRLCPLKGGQPCDGRWCVFAVASPFHTDYDEFYDEEGDSEEWKTVTRTWCCSAIRDVDIEVDSRVTKWRRPLPVETQ